MKSSSGSGGRNW